MPTSSGSGSIRPKPHLRVDHLSAGYGAAPIVNHASACVGLGRIVTLGPGVLILDEPTSNLSADLSRLLLEEHVRGLRQAGTAVLIVEQKALAALTISDWAYVMAGGTMKVDAAAKDLLARKDIGEVFLGRNTGGAGEPMASGGMG